VNEYQDFRPPAAPLAEAPADPHELAGRGARLAAKIVDGLTVLAVLLVAGVMAAIGISLATALHGPGAMRVLGLSLAAILAGLTGFLCLVALIIWNCIWLQRYGQTVGKRVLHVRIVRSSGERASLGRIFGLRYLPMMLLGAIPKLGALITLIDYLLIFRDSRRCLHDQIADTKVVKAE
jgi:uncharacterized RDD family membrane protein YckC